MEGPYLRYFNTAGPRGPVPDRRWNGLANQLRQQSLLEQAGYMVGHMVASEGFNSADEIERAGANFADAIQPPLDSAEREQFFAGIQGTIAVNLVIGEAQ